MKPNIEIFGLRVPSARPAARRGSRVVMVASIIATSIVLIATSAPAATEDWNSYLNGPKHSSFNPGATAFTPTTAKSIVPDWTFTAAPPTGGQPPVAFVASPTVSNGVVYIGSNTGVFYAIREISDSSGAAGTEIWHRDLGFAAPPRCPPRGISSTAAIAVDPNTGLSTVYVGGGDGYLYALRASDGVTVWSMRVVDVATGGYNWASPTIPMGGGHVYMGISSDCDKPLIRGGIMEFDQAFGTLLHTYYSVPENFIGGSVWTSPASDGTSVWATIGNPQPTQTNVGDCFAIVRLDAILTRQDSWIVPNTAGSDLDWGSSPTLFDATLNATLTTMVGAASKNGKFYAFKANDLASGPVWKRMLGATGGNFKTKGLLLAAPIWDFTDKRLFVGSDETKIGGVTVPGSMRELDPATGKVIWARKLLGGPIVGSPTMSAGGVIAAATYNQATPTANAVYLLNASNGHVVNTIPEDTPIFAQPVFADTHLFVATTLGVLTAYSVAP